ncbi:MAG: hypothetical protein Q9157_003749 [Trypethelium eluteriae]
MPVQKSDGLTIPEEGEWKKIPITWTQSREDHIEDYLSIEFTNTRGIHKPGQKTGETEKTNFLFVSEKLLDKFKSSIKKTDTGFKITVDDDYLFGQQKGGKNRFLVYHDKKRVIYQHRFIQGTLVAISKQAADISANLMGDKLHPWAEA